MFKTKNKKIYAGDSRITLDARHQFITSQFETNTNLYNKILKQKHEIEIKLTEKRNQITKHKDEPPNIHSINEIYVLEQSLEQIEQEICDIQQNKTATNYYLKNGDLLCQYYQHLESIAQKPENIQTQPQQPSTKKTFRAKTIKAKGKRNFSWMENTTTRGTNILTFFQQPETPKEDLSIETDDVEEQPIIKLEETYPQPSQEPNQDFDRANALEQYLQEIDPNYAPPKSSVWMIDFCPVCLEINKVRRELLLQQGDGVLICKDCGHMEQVVIDSEKPSYKDPPPEATYFAYKRINHFNEWLNQIQAKESTEIPPEVYQYILEEIRKERITDLAVLSNDKIRTILKKLRLNKYYEHIPHIINKLNGLPPPILTREVEEKLRAMFKEIQLPFLEVCPKERKNFLSYSYTLHKCVELLNLHEYKSLFPLLKSREKLHKTDLLWAQICVKLGWIYHKSI